MKKIKLRLIGISLLLMSGASGASSDGIVEKLEGTWLSNFFPASIAPGTTASFPSFFLTGDVGGAWKFERDGRLVLFLPCDVNKRFRKGDIAIGTWRLDQENHLHMRVKPLDESESPLEIDGKVEFDSYPSQRNGAGTMTISSANRGLHMGRYDESAWDCSLPQFN